MLRKLTVHHLKGFTGMNRAIGGNMRTESELSTWVAVAYGMTHILNLQSSDGRTSLGPTFFRVLRPENQTTKPI